MNELRRSIEAAWSGHEWRPWGTRRAMAVESLVDEIHAELGCGYRACLYCSRLGYTREIR